MNELIKKLNHRNLRSARWQNSDFMKEVLRDKEMARVLQNPKERKTYFETIKEIENKHYKSGKYKLGDTDKLNIFREANWRFKNTAGDGIEADESRVLANKTVPFGPKYVKPAEDSQSKFSLKKNQIMERFTSPRQVNVASYRNSAVKNQEQLRRPTAVSNVINRKKTVAPATVSGRNPGSAMRLAKPLLMK